MPDFRGGEISKVLTVKPLSVSGMKPKSAGCTDSGRTGNGTDTDDRCREVAGESTWAARQWGGRHCAGAGFAPGPGWAPDGVAARGS